jgi:hypothetical protein
MNYKAIHDKFILHFKNTKSRTRLTQRNPNDPRLKHMSLYQEVHHIIPRSLGGNNSSDNLVEVLPEEHIFLHMLRYKIYSKREDILAVRFSLNGYNCDNVFKGEFSKTLNKKIRMGYAWIKAHAYKLRQTEGWQTEDGRKRISEARKGTIVVKNCITGEIIGSVSNKHPNIINGTWVHHTKGRKISDTERLKRKMLGRGANNNNHSGLTDQYLIDKGIEAAKEFSRILSWCEMMRLSEQRNFKWLKGIKSRFDNQGRRGYYKEIEARTEYKYIQTNRNTISVTTNL